VVDCIDCIDCIARIYIMIMIMIIIPFSLKSCRREVAYMMILLFFMASS
jgi:hypothetical protein